MPGTRSVPTGARHQSCEAHPRPADLTRSMGVVLRPARIGLRGRRHLRRRHPQRRPAHGQSWRPHFDGTPTVGPRAGEHLSERCPPRRSDLAGCRRRRFRRQHEHPGGRCDPAPLAQACDAAVMGVVLVDRRSGLDAQQVRRNIRPPRGRREALATVTDRHAPTPLWPQNGRCNLPMLRSSRTLPNARVPHDSPATRGGVNRKKNLIDRWMDSRSGPCGATRDQPPLTGGSTAS